MTPNRTPILLTRRQTAGAAIALGTSLLVKPGLMAQESTPVATPAASPVAASAQIANLMTADIEQLPEAPFTIRLLRITLEAGAITPMHTHHGPEIDMVEAGEVTIRSLGDAPVTRADGTSETSTGDDVVLAVGDMVHFPAEVGMYFENTGDEAVTLLSAVINPVGPDFINERITWLDGEPDLEGVGYQKLGDGLVQDLPQQAGTWTIDDITLPAAFEMPAIVGIAMATPVNGNFSFTIDEGEVQVTRSDNNSLQPNAVPGTDFSLAEGDAAFFPSGVKNAARDGQNATLQYLAMAISLADGPTNEPAEITFIEGDGTVAGSGGEVEAGATVTTNTDSVNMRVEPSVEADVVEQLGEGVELNVLDGPVEADDYSWYQVQVVGEGGNEGWIASEFLDGVSAPEPTAEAAATPTGDSGEFPVGSTVVTNDASVRLRPEASTESEAIDALDEGTELTVTGEPVEAEEYTWLPVETADGIAGFVVIDFVEAAP